MMCTKFVIENVLFFNSHVKGCLQAKHVFFFYLAGASSLYVCIRRGSACVGGCVFVCTLVGNIATSSGDTQDAERKNHTGLEANIWRVDLKWQTNTTRRSFLTS